MLGQLKVTIEILLGCHPATEWDVYGGIYRLHAAVVDILNDGFRFFRDSGEPDLWVFIQGLSWLQPTLAASPSFLGHVSPVRSPFRKTDKALTWLYSSIDSRSLSEKLSWLLSDHQHLLSCYRSTAFLRQTQYNEATLMCLRALEQRQLQLLAKIDPSLYKKQKSVNPKTHRRCLSYPEPNTGNDKSWFIGSRAQNVSKLELQCSVSKTVRVNTDNSPKKEHNADESTEIMKNINTTVFKGSVDDEGVKRYIKQYLLKKCFSSSDIYLLCHKEKCKFNHENITNVRTRTRSFSESSTSEEQSSTKNNLFSDLLVVKYDKPGNNAKERRASMPSNRKNTKNLSSSESMSSIDSVISKKEIGCTSRRGRRRSSFFRLPFLISEESEYDKDSESDDSKTLVQVNATLESNCKQSLIENSSMSLGSFPKPTPGQSIMSFLTSGAFSQMTTELERENAHFNISEAMIAAFEQVKFNQRLKLADEIAEESDEEINQLKRIIRIRRQQKQKEKCFTAFDSSFVENIDTMTTDQSVNSLSSSVYSTSESISTDQDDDIISEKSNLPSIAETGRSVSKLSVFNDEIVDSKSEFVSAENVAISLLRKFKENQLPGASEIEWLVSENDAPQQILPLPTSILVDDSAETHSDKDTLLRGTIQWAPPRPQIIFTTHPSPSKRQLIERQMYRCAGCGIVVAKKYASKFRYCEYLGRYFCPSCHNKQTALIPGRILSKWDFSKYPVSNFSYSLLDRMSTDPLFNVLDLNSSLYRQVRELQRVRLLRIALFYLKDFIFSCRCTGTLQNVIKEEPSHIYTDPDCYSISDFINVKNGKLFKTLTVLVKHCENHVNHCQLCQARGFMCEICRKQEVIFPWDIKNVVRCSSCHSCHHIKCYQRQLVCPKCVRINNRNNLQNTGLCNSLDS